MASISHRRGDIYGASPYISREGLSTRQVASSDEIQLRIDPIHGDVDDQITDLRKQVKQLRNVAQDVGSEAKFQNDFLNQLVYLFYNPLLENFVSVSSYLLLVEYLDQ
ncbi:hypothetical protein Vadar_026812 [Vaccinium darrowii]|uniref:Uncharacterized protein n=1 Tax=Vaccinium darrowii TaxID=229202 RepID=A0ACB7Y9F4_9ERIC|nr:hypothetical protein Vadar_026812 [Vaccinium darrowii]